MNFDMFTHPRAVVNDKYESVLSKLGSVDLFHHLQAVFDQKAKDPADSLLKNKILFDYPELTISGEPGTSDFDSSSLRDDHTRATEPID